MPTFGGNNSATSPPNIFMPYISELDDLFFGLHLIAFTVVGKNLGNRAGVSNLLNHPPNLENWQEMVNFAESCPPMLNIDLHPCK